MMKRVIFGMAILIPASAQAATLCDIGRTVTNCFHPTANYAGCEQTGQNTAIARFRGGVTGRPYSLQYRVEKKNDFMRVVLLDDNAVMPPNSSCPLAQWQPARDEPTSMTEMQRIRHAIEEKWHVPAVAKGAEKLVVYVKVSVLPDGTVTNAQVRSEDPAAEPNPDYQAIADSAHRAVLAASPLPIPVNKYEQFKDFELAFNLRRADKRTAIPANELDKLLMSIESRSR